MSCEECDKFQDGKVKKGEVAYPKVLRFVMENEILGAAYYRWGNANIEMQGCDKHLKEIFTVLDKVQK